MVKFTSICLQFLTINPYYPLYLNTSTILNKIVIKIDTISKIPFNFNNNDNITISENYRMYDLVGSVHDLYVFSLYATPQILIFNFSFMFDIRVMVGACE